HPTRKEQVEDLQAMLDRDVPVAWDPNPEPSPDPQRRWATGRAAWELHDADADWHLVIQDDAVYAPTCSPASNPRSPSSAPRVSSPPTPAPAAPISATSAEPSPKPRNTATRGSTPGH